jgi:glycosyltransferase involved in cell wall biosynthesis
MVGPRDILYVGPDAWDGVEKRPHHLVRRLARSRRVLWLNPGLVQEVPRFLAEPVKRLRLGRAYAGTERGRVRLLYTPPDAPNVRVLSVLAPLPLGGRHPLLHEANAAVVAPQVALAMRVAGFSQPAFVAAHPKAHALARRLGLPDVAYDSMDDFGAFDGRHSAEVIDALERDLVQNARFITATAQALVGRIAAMGREATLLPNGVDLEVFDREGASPLEAAPGRVFGFVGLLADWVDLGFFETLARSRPSDRVVIVGPLKSSLSGTVDALRRLPNVRIVGPVPYADVPRWMRAFDACLLPFRRDRLTDAVNPIKLYEYFALGKPVLATGLPEVAQYDDLVTLTDAPGGLPGALAALETEWSDETLARDRRNRRRAVAERHSWDSLAARFQALLDAP